MVKYFSSRFSGSELVKITDSMQCSRTGKARTSVTRTFDFSSEAVAVGGQAQGFVIQCPSDIWCGETMLHLQFLWSTCVVHFNAFFIIFVFIVVHLPCVCGASWYLTQQVVVQGAVDCVLVVCSHGCMGLTGFLLYTVTSATDSTSPFLDYNHSLILLHSLALACSGYLTLLKLQSLGRPATNSLPQSACLLAVTLFGLVLLIEHKPPLKQCSIRGSCKATISALFRIQKHSGCHIPFGVVVQQICLSNYQKWECQSFIISFCFLLQASCMKHWKISMYGAWICILAP